MSRIIKDFLGDISEDIYFLDHLGFSGGRYLRIFSENISVLDY